MTGLLTLLGPIGSRVLGAVVVALVLGGLVGWLQLERQRRALAEARVEAAEAAVAAARAERDRLLAAIEAREAEARRAVEARRAAERQLAERSRETARLLGEVRAARERARREPQPTLTAEEVAECRAIGEAYRQLLSQP